METKIIEPKLRKKANGIFEIVYYSNKKKYKTTKKTKKQTRTDENGKFIIEVDKRDQLILETTAFEKFIYRPKEGEKSMKANLIFQNKKKNERGRCDI